MVATISNSSFTSNLASGGAGTVANGGAYVGAGGSATIDQTNLIANLALGGPASSGGSDSDGSGAGLYVATGTTVSLKKSQVAGNFASTSNNDIDGTVTYP